MSAVGGKLSKEEWRRQKDLDAARKAGTAPAEVDEDGKAINPHIPEYIVKAPWYADTGHASLKHQKNWAAVDESKIAKIGEWYDRGAKAGPAAKKYRKGACENCGAITHTKKDCLERPRKKGAKFTNSNIAADEVIQTVKGGYDAKRDRYNGYDPASHAEVYKEYTAMEEERKRLREEEVDKQTSTELAAVAKKGKTEDDDAFGSSDEDEHDDDKYADEGDAVGQKLDTKNRVSVRNLRIREDTAKYLLNLDTESAYYDPKTRSMRDAPVKGNPEEMTFAGDNFQRYSGDAARIQKLQLFAWQSAARGNDVHMNANPTQGELLHKDFQEKKEQLRDTNKISILAKYGGAEHLEKVPKELLTGQTENYVEYSRTGTVIKGQERAKAKSKYDEDVLLNNHTSVWGSWYDLASGIWGFACCHLTIPGSYCTGKAGIAANEENTIHKMLESAGAREEQRKLDSERAQQKSLAEQHLENVATGKGKGPADPEVKQNFSKGRLGEGDEIALDKERLKAAIAAEKKRKGVTDEDEAWNQAKRSKTDVTEEDMEAYRLTRTAAFDDPMANYKDDEL
ncbi:mRNA processing-related protein [Filobasidium floriforme]|uniref:mRNA processing-related protein n=1 Tax=Filobasidium floriforme TaxID=5210 RepID=UPI001E8DA415|nr:mRNA processing-related protein [Filobasidium floriforme]KAH8087926.1 mRNA processing-related protein [Filobasidium floriforme]